MQTSCDLLVTMGHPFTGLSEKSIPMPPEIRKEIDGIPGVAITDVYRKAFVAYKDSKILLESIDVKNRLVTVPGGKHGGFTPEERLRIFKEIREFLR